MAFLVTDRPPFHLAGHGPQELLDPIRAELAKLEERTRHYRERIPLQSGDVDAALDAASAALATARAAIEVSLGGEEATSTAANPAPTERKRVLITGAGGRIGSDLAERLRDRYDLRLMYNRHVPTDPPVGDTVTANCASFDQVAAAMDGIDAVVHLAADPSTKGAWESVLENNINGTYNIYEAARQAGVQRIVLASTNHVMGMYDRDRQWPIYADQPVRPDSLYGVSKAFGEALGRFWYDQHGVSVICLRIGWWLPEPKDDISRWMWLSPRDCAQVVSCAIDSDLGFGVFYAISANSSRHWDITNTIELLGYRPEDDAERYFSSEGV